MYIPPSSLYSVPPLGKGGKTSEENLRECTPKHSFITGSEKRARQGERGFDRRELTKM